MHTLQCRAVAKARRFGPVNQTKNDGCLTGLLTGPKPGQSSAFWSGQQTRQTRVSLCLVDRTKTPCFGHSSTLQGVHIGQKFFLGCYLHTKCVDSLSLIIITYILHN
ncbi:hypothetical protein Hanom_Chr13g01212611 [Helianthus anomalus]